MPPQLPPAVGIDLGTTFSVVSVLDAHGHPRTLVNAEGDLTTPSAVLFEDTGITVGKEAAKAGVFEPERIARFAKRDMGQKCYHRPISGEQVPPEVIQSLVLKKVKRDAEAIIGPFRQAVVTVPAYFNEPRRKSTQDAARLAGVDVLDLVNEPTAAAMAYGVTRGFVDAHGRAFAPERILVYDLGGGTFDVTLMDIDGPNFRTVATAGDVLLGGLDWDQRIADYVAEKFLLQHPGADPREDETSAYRLLREAEDAKRALSSRERTSFVFEHGNEGVRIAVTREQFESLTADLLHRTRLTVRRVLKDAGRTWSDITRILLVGGSTRMPAVQRMLEQESGKIPDRSLAADEAVAHGAAIYAGFLLSRSEMTVTDVNSHSLGVLGTETKTGRPRTSVLIPRNTPLPATKSRKFKTKYDDQRSVVVPVVEGGDSSGRNASPIGDCIIRDLPPGLTAGTTVEVLFAFTKGGRLTVRARLPVLDREAVLTIERVAGMNDADFSLWQDRLKRDFDEI